MRAQGLVEQSDRAHEVGVAGKLFEQLPRLSATGDDATTLRMAGAMTPGVFVTAAVVALGACVHISGDPVDSGVGTRRDAGLGSAGSAGNAGSAGRVASAASGSGASVVAGSTEPPTAGNTAASQADAGASVPASPAPDSMMAMPEVPAGMLGSPCGSAADCAGGPCQQCSAKGSCEPLPFGDGETCLGAHSCSAGRCAEIDQASTEAVLDLTLSAGKTLAQTLTVGKTGKLVEVRLTQGCGRTLSLRSLNSSGVPADTSLTDSIQSTVHLDGLTESYEFDLDVASGERLAIVLRNDQGTDCSVPVATGNPYLGGKLLSWNAADASWTPVADNDMAFKLLLVH